MFDSSYDHPYNFNKAQKIILFVSKVLIDLIGGCLLGLSSFNIYNYLYKHQKYKEPTILVFYFAAVSTILLCMAITFVIPITNYCYLEWLMAIYGI